MRGRTAFVVVLAAVVLVAWCGWVSAFHRTSGVAEVSWIVSLAAVVTVDVAMWRGSRGRRLGVRLARATEPWPRPGRGGATRALRGVAPWLVLILVALAWDILGIDTGPHEYHLTISALAQAYRPLNAAVLLIWLLVGVGYEAARVRAPIEGRSSTRHATTPKSSTPSSPGTDQRDEPGTRGLLGASVLSVGSHPGSPALLLPSSPPVGVAFWIAVPVATIAIDLAARRSSGTVATAEEFVRFISVSRMANVLLIVAWAFAGYHLFAR